MARNTHLCAFTAWLVISCSALLALLSIATAASSTSSPNSANLVLSLDWSTSAPISQPVPGNFFGLSLEWCNPLHLLGPNLSHPHTSFHHVFPYMSTREGAGPTLRVGGSSSDRSWYNPLGRPTPDWQDFVANITDDTYTALERASLYHNSSIIAGVSFRLAYNGSIFAPEIAAMSRIVDPQAWGTRWTVEIGNEQELYDACGSHPYEDYRSAVAAYISRSLQVDVLTPLQLEPLLPLPSLTCLGLSLPVELYLYRPCGWGWNNFTVEWDWEREAITQLLPYSLDGRVFQGGAFCCPYFQSKMAAWTIARASRLSSLSFHRYVWNGCGDNPTLDTFLSDYASLSGLQRPLEGNITLQSAIAAVHSAIGPQFPVYLGEGNSVGCEGMAGITDAFAQVVWLVDYAMALVSFNVSGFHMYIGWTDPTMFLATPFIWPDPSKDEVRVEATMYGMWMFAFATWNGASLIDHQRLRVDDVGNATKSWTLMDNDGNIVLLLVRKDQQPINVTVTLQLLGVNVGYDANTIETSAPSMSSKTGLSMAGLTWEGTTNGLPVPTAFATAAGYRSTAVTARRVDGDGAMMVAYDVAVRPASVLAVVIPTFDDKGASWKRRVAAILRPQPAGTVASSSLMED